MEPSAAALAFGYHKTDYENYNMLVFDFGGGTLDAVVVKASKGKIHVVNVGGDSELGGRDIDALLMEHVNNIFKARYKEDCFADHRKKQRLNAACIAAKQMLTFSNKAE